MAEKEKKEKSVDSKSAKAGSRRRQFHALLFGLLTGFIGVILSLTPLGDEFEKNVGLTWLFKARGPIAPPPQVAVVAINERASSAINLPALPRDWPRSIHATLVDNLVKRGAAAIVFDVDFHRAKDTADDKVFAHSVANSQRTVLIQLLTGKHQPVFDATGKMAGNVWMEQLIPPIPSLVQSAAGLAPFPVPKVQTNVFRFYAFKSTASDVGTLPAVALQLYSLDIYDQWRNALQQAGIEASKTLPEQANDLRHSGALREAMNSLRRTLHNDPEMLARLQSTIANTQTGSPDDRKRLTALAKLYGGPENHYINFYGPPGTIPTIPYNAAITGSDPNVDPALLDVRGKVVFVGFSDLYDPGQPDRFYTVFTDDNGVDLSGVEIAATCFANLLTDRTIEPAGTGALIAIVFVFGFGLAVIVYLLSANFAVPLSLALAAAYAFSGQWLFSNHDYWLPLAVPLLVQLPLAVFVGLLAQYFLERRQHHRMSKAVSFYLPEHIAKELVDKEIDPSALNKVVRGTCLATDMSGFTRISQSMDPSELAKFMNDYFEALARALKEHHVDVTEFHADTVMCAWTEDATGTLDSAAPLLAALATVRAVADFNAAREGLSLNARVGLDQGNFYLGHTGGGGRFGYSILGDSANTASRLEGLNKLLSTHILASEAATTGATGLLLRPMGRFLLLGKAMPISVVEIVAEKAYASEHQIALCEGFAHALDAYNKQEWSRAQQLFSELLGSYPEDGPSRFYIDRCRQLEAVPTTSDDPCLIIMDSK